MLGHQALKGSSVVHCPRPSQQLGRVFNRIAANVKQTRCRSAAPASQQDLGKLSSSSVTLGSSAPRRRTPTARRKVTSNATSRVQASYASPAPDAKSSLTPVLVAVAIASLGALLFGLHVAIVNGLQDAVSAELGFSANTGLRGAVSVLSSCKICIFCCPMLTYNAFNHSCRWFPWCLLVLQLEAHQEVAWQMAWAGANPSCCQPFLWSLVASFAQLLDLPMPFWLDGSSVAWALV